MVAEPCADAEMAHDDETVIEIKDEMSDRVERREHDETEVEIKDEMSDRVERRKHDETMIEQKERTKAYEQQAADAREYAIMLEAELQRIYAGILALMDELIPSATTGEPKAFYSEKKDDYHRFLAERATGDAKWQAPMIQKVLKTVEAPQMQYSDRIVDLPVVTQRRIPIIQTAQRTVEVPKIVSQDSIQQQSRRTTCGHSSSSGYRGNH